MEIARGNVGGDPGRLGGSRRGGVDEAGAGVSVGRGAVREEAKLSAAVLLGVVGTDEESARLLPLHEGGDRASVARGTEDFVRDGRDAESALLRDGVRRSGSGDGRRADNAVHLRPNGVGGRPGGGDAEEAGGGAGHVGRTGGPGAPREVRHRRRDHLAVDHRRRARVPDRERHAESQGAGVRAFNVVTWRR